ncbi:MAG TPA: hypothetical protein PKC24_13080 [Cyclobacteriaceae bacterium]|nr:hypothetical protein [Cyclobacteriaceae bacterium]
MSRIDLIKRLNWYYPLERIHAFMTFPIITIYLFITYPLFDIIFLLYGLILCNVILIQGQHYWKLKLYSLTDKPFDQAKHLTFFRKSKKLNLIMIILIPSILAVQLHLNNWMLKIDSLFFWGVFANIFAVLEHINYYMRQLMIDKISDLNFVIRNGKLKKASLAKDLIDNKI